jgi:hypothetical protein
VKQPALDAQHPGAMQVANPIYQRIFNLAWVNQQLGSRQEGETPAP